MLLPRNVEKKIKYALLSEKKKKIMSVVGNPHSHPGLIFKMTYQGADFERHTVSLKQ